MVYISNVVLYEITDVMIRFNSMPVVLYIVFPQASEKYVRLDFLT